MVTAGAPARRQAPSPSALPDEVLMRVEDAAGLPCCGPARRRCVGQARRLAPPPPDHYDETRNAMKKHERDELLHALKVRFEENMHRHPGLAWADVGVRLEGNLPALGALLAMESTRGEPDVIAHDGVTGQYTFCDCSEESPAGRRSVCFDGEALRSRKEHRPENSAVEMAAAMGIDLLTEEQYRELQRLGEFDTRTSSWVMTPPDVRALGGALFCDRRYGRVFVYHNGAQSYYAARGFRGLLRV